MEETNEKKQERAVLVGLNADCFTVAQTATEETLDELEALLETAGGFCTGKVLQNRHTPDSHSFIGEGKAQEVRMLVEFTQSTMVVFERLDSGYFCPTGQNEGRPAAGGAGPVSVFAAPAFRHGQKSQPSGRRHRHPGPRRDQAGIGPAAHPGAYHPAPSGAGPGPCRWWLWWATPTPENPPFSIS